jgi:hypothetical protein
MSANKWETLKQRVPQGLIKSRKQGGNSLSYIEWFTACDLLDERAPGWTCEVKQVGEICGKVYIRVALTIDGVTRENIGYEDEDMKGFGDVFSNSFAMALKRAAALFGIARHLYDKDEKRPQVVQQRPSNVQQMPYSNAPKTTEGATSDWQCGEQVKREILDLEAACESNGIPQKSLRDRLEVSKATRNPATLSKDDAAGYRDFLKKKNEQARSV